MGAGTMMEGMGLMVWGLFSFLFGPAPDYSLNFGCGGWSYNMVSGR